MMLKHTAASTIVTSMQLAVHGPYFGTVHVHVLASTYIVHEYDIVHEYEYSIVLDRVLHVRIRHGTSLVHVVHASHNRHACVYSVLTGSYGTCM